MPTTKVVLIVEYDGTRYHGFQWQANAATVQDEIERAIKRLTGEELRIMAASRTDTGVHAKGQVVSFKVESHLPRRSFIDGLNYHLPDDIAVKKAYRAADSFDVRRDAVSRQYKYYIFNSPTRSPFVNGFAHRVFGGLDIDAMNEASESLVGEHDLASFMSCLGGEVSSTRRTVTRAHVDREGEFVVFDIEAGSFLPHQVRNTMGPLIQVGRGRMSGADFRGIMELKQPGSASPAAPPCGLFLMRVNYPGPIGEEAW